jgi:hypothetical protein
MPEFSVTQRKFCMDYGNLGQLMEPGRLDELKKSRPW